MLDVMPLVMWAAGVLLTIVVAVMVILYADARHKAIEAQRAAGEELHGLALMPVSWATVAMHIASLFCFIVAFAFYVTLPADANANLAGFYESAKIPAVIIAFVLLFAQIGLMLTQTLIKLE